MELETLRIEKDLGNKILVKELDAITSNGKVVSYATDIFYEAV